MRWKRSEFDTFGNCIDIWRISRHALEKCQRREKGDVLHILKSSNQVGQGVSACRSPRFCRNTLSNVSKKETILSTTNTRWDLLLEWWKPYQFTSQRNRSLWRCKEFVFNKWISNWVFKCRLLNLCSNDYCCQTENVLDVLAVLMPHSRELQDWLLECGSSIPHVRILARHLVIESHDKMEKVIYRYTRSYRSITDDIW